MDAMDFSEISASVQRLTPQIFTNLRDQSSVASRDRLKGSYRYTWTKNVRLWSMASDLFTTLRAREIDYRLLKGAAMHARGGSVGSRTIGDFDLLISERDLTAVTELLGELGFRQEGSRQIRCGHAITEDAAINFNRGDCHVDVHVAPRKAPRTLLSLMLSEEPVCASVGGVDVLLPTDELLLLHAAWHAVQQTSPTDLAQGLIDVALLARAVSLADIETAARAAGQSAALTEAATALDEAGVDTVLTGAQLARESAGSSTRQGAAPGRIALPRALNLLRARRVTDLPPLHDRSAVRGQGVRYRLWLRLGRPGRVERLMSGARGFLNPPSRAISFPTSLRPFSGIKDDQVTANPWRVASLDWRFAVVLPPDTRKVEVLLDGKCLEHLDAALFVNGAFKGRVIAGDSSLRLTHLDVSSRELEISLRPLWAACPSCFPPLDNLMVKVTDLG